MFVLSALLLDDALLECIVTEVVLFLIIKNKTTSVTIHYLVKC